MAKIIMLVPGTERAGLRKVAKALTEAFLANGVKAAYFEPIDQKAVTEETNKPYSISLKHARYLVGRGYLNEVLEEIVAMYERDIAKDNEVVIVKGMAYFASQPLIFQRNLNIAKALSANVIVLASAARAKDKDDLDSQINNVATGLGGSQNKNFLGYIINDAEIPGDYIDSPYQYITSIFSNHKSPSEHGKDKAEIEFIAKQFSRELLFELLNKSQLPKLTPPRFMQSLVEQSRQANKIIVLPESDDVRVLKAASVCARKSIAKCVLLGDRQEILSLAEKNDIEITEDIVILDPSAMVEKYVHRLVEIRKSKGMTEALAREALEDRMTLATMMLECGHVDGVVSGAIHTTANTIRPALQIIKTVPGMSLVSSVFFMFLPDQVFVYGDCAVNPSPNANELAQIAIQSADSAKMFKIDPKVAMISYSTGDSGSGIDVEKVREATNIVKKLRPDIAIDGPLQYDAATSAEVAALKMPNSPIAGNANVFIFPDLNTGNALYKAVQRSANILSIGPMLQGLNKPVNDLSRGCVVEDIIFTVALTAVQALHIKS